MSDLALTQKAGNAANNEADQAKLEVASAASIKPLPALSLRPLDAAWNTSWDALAGQSVANGSSADWPYRGPALEIHGDGYYATP